MPALAGYSHVNLNDSVSVSRFISALYEPHSEAHGRLGNIRGELLGSLMRRRYGYLFNADDNP